MKYTLARLERDLSQRVCDPETDPGTVEHILSENPGATGEEFFPPKRWDQSIYRLAT